MFSDCNGKQNWLTSFMVGAVTGSLYGATNIIVGQPLDTIKTKMQTQSNLQANRSLVSCFSETLKKDGFKGLYKGSISAMLGSISFRAVQWAVYDATYVLTDSDSFSYKIPFTGGLEVRVVISSISAATSRAVVECPFEYVKVKRQIGESWLFKDVYKGFGLVWARDVPLFIVALGLIDSMKRHTKLMDSYAGIFAGTGLCASVAWASIWPLETLKNQIQAEKTGSKTTIKQKIAVLNRQFGTLGLFRGLGPGMLSVFFRTGASFVVLYWSQKEMNVFLNQHS